MRHRAQPSKPTYVYSQTREIRLEITPQFNVIAKVIGVLMILGSLAILVVFLVGVLAFGTTNFPDFPFHSSFLTI